MLEENQQEQQASEQRALGKAKHHEELTLKQKQASKAAEHDPTKLSSKKVPNATAGTVQLPVALAPDDAFSSRVVQSTKSNNTRANLASQLTVRKSSVPPVPMKAAKATSMLPPRNRVATPGQLSKFQQLKRQATPFPIALSNMTPKRVDHHVTPATSTKVTDNSNGGDTELCDSADSDHCQWVPKKCARHMSVPSDNDEGHEASEGLINMTSEDSFDTSAGTALSHGTTMNPAAAMDSKTTGVTMNPTTATDSETTKAGANLGRPKVGDYDAATRTLLQST
ncbi:hypothetical protein OG21DRAFT_1487406 [Imleria badia]|nr:hypothetical protein OG21DRAFT_1487406 [Imleria badia]